MPSVSGKQHRLMAMVANDPAAAKRLGIPQSVGSEFMKADKGRKFGDGGRVDVQSINKPKTNHGKSALFAKGGDMAKKLFGGKESYAEELKEAKAIKSGRITPQQYAREEQKEERSMKVKKMAGGGDTTMSNPSRERRGLTAEKMGGVKVGGTKKFGEHAVQERGHTRGKNMGDAGKEVGIMRGGMKRGGKVAMKRGGKC